MLNLSFIKRILIVGVKIFIYGFVLLLLVLLSVRFFTQYRISKNASIPSNGINTVEKISLGGVDQWISIRGYNTRKPVLLILHGGPGTPDMPLAAKHDGALLNHFIVVHWDQRGAGKSYASSLDSSSITTAQFLSDTVELTDLLRTRFNRQKIYLMGHSYGATLGILAITKAPEKYYAFFGVSQPVNDEGDTLGYNFALNQAQSHDNKKAIQELQRIGAPPYKTVADLAALSRWIDEYGGTGRKYTIGNYITDVFTSPDYSLSDTYRFYKGQEFSIVAMVNNDQLYGRDLLKTNTRFQIPVYFFQGRYDYNTPGVLVEKYVNAIEAPVKKLLWFEESAHFPQWEEPEKFENEVVKIILAIQSL